MRVVFFGTPEIAVPSLLRLHASRHRVERVVTQTAKPSGRGLATRPSAVAAAARGLGLALREPERLRGALVEELRALAPDALAVVAYGKLLPAELLAVARAGAVNLHASLLPRHRGASPIAAALLAGDRETGVTTMRMDEGLDTGDVLLAESTPIGEEEDAVGLGQRLAEMGGELLVRTLDRLEQGDLRPVPQDPAAATYAPRLRAEDAPLDWSAPASALARRVRALRPWPGTTTTLPSGRRLKVVRARAAAQSPPGGEPGTVVAAAAAGIEVACGAGRLLLLEAQPDGKRVLAAADLVNGRYLRTGDRLGA